MEEEIQEIIANIDEESMKEYQRFFEQFDREKRGYVMAIQVRLPLLLLLLPVPSLSSSCPEWSSGGCWRWGR